MSVAITAGRRFDRGKESELGLIYLALTKKAKTKAPLLVLEGWQPLRLTGW